MAVHALRLVALLSLLLVHVSAASHVHLRVRKHHHKHAPRAAEASVSTASTESAAVECPAHEDPLAGAQRPVLAAACPSSCANGDLCVFFPAAFTGKCVTTGARSCFHGDSCAFQCLTNPGHTGGWYVTLYTDASVLDDVATFNLARSDDQSVALNASLIGGWVSGNKTLEGVVFVSLTGNEAANNLPDWTNGDGFYEDAQSLSRSQVVGFELPSSFFKDVQGVQSLRVENLVLPESTKDVTLSFPALTELLFRNTKLSEFPLQNSALPAVTFMDLSVNNLREITRAALPPNLQYLNLSDNAIQKVDKGAIPDTLLAVDLGYNQIQTIDVGTFPSTLNQLYLEYNQLTQIPRDIATMEDLTTLYLDGNNISQVPDRSIPTESMEMLSLRNCSLRSLPSLVLSMTELTDLYLSGNDFRNDLDLSKLPKKLETLNLDSCNLKKLPTGLNKLEYLTYLSLMDNPNAMETLPVLPLRIETLDISNNRLEALPDHIQNLTALDYLSLMMNPLSNLSAGSLPPAIRQVDMSDTTYRTIPNDTLPDTLVYLTITNSTLEDAPEDIRSMSSLTEVEISNAALRSFDVATGLPELTLLNLRSNALTRFSGRFPKLTTLDLRNNSLVDFNVTSAPYLQTLHLSDNKLTTMPSAIFQFPGLLLLNVSGNPIKNYTPSATEFTTLSRMSVVVLDQAMFSTDCEESVKGDMRGYTVCLPDGVASGKAKSSKVSTALVLLNVGLAVVLCVLVVFMWRRRQLQKRRLEELRAKTEKLEKQQKTQDMLTTSSIWTDPVLLQHRIDDDLVVQGRLLGSGMYGEVWLATYRGGKVALKRLKPTSDQAAIQNFVDEIKIVMKLSHVRVVRFVGVMWTKETDIALLTEYMAGGDLRAYLDSNAKQVEGWTQRMMKIALHITEAIVYLHSMEPVVIHRDLKSRNVLLNAKMQAKLSDFGIARYKMDDVTMTASVGTIRWIAPEVLLGKRYDESVDIYSLGIILSEIDTHELPFADVTDETGNEQLSDSIIAGLILSGSLTTSFSDSCPSEIRTLAERCMSRDPEARPTGLVVAYELRKMLRSASWTSEGGTFRSSSSGADAASDVAVRPSEPQQQEETTESSSTPKYISV